MDFSYISRKNKDNSEFDFDTSLTMAPHELRDIMANSEKTDITLREMMDDGSATGIILKSKEPWRDINSNLYYEFMESIQSHLPEPEVFNTIADFIQNCTDTLELMRGEFSIFSSFFQKINFFFRLFIIKKKLSNFLKIRYAGKSRE